MTMTVADTINLCRLAEWLERLPLLGEELAGCPISSRALGHASSIRAALAEIDRLRSKLQEAERWLDSFGVMADDEPSANDLPSRILMVCEQEAQARQERDSSLAEIDRLKARVAELDGPFRLSGEPLPEHLSRPLSRSTIRLAAMLHDLPVEVADSLAERLIKIARNTREAAQ